MKQEKGGCFKTPCGRRDFGVQIKNDLVLIYKKNDKILELLAVDIGAHRLLLE